MRLTPDSRAPAKADPSARAGVVVVVGGGVVVVDRCWPYLGAGLPLSWPEVVVVVVVVVLVFCCRCCCIWAQVCPCLGPRLWLLLLWLLLVLLLLWLSLSSLCFVVVVVLVVVVVGRWWPYLGAGLPLSWP